MIYSFSLVTFGEVPDQKLKLTQRKKVHSKILRLISFIVKAMI